MSSGMGGTRTKPTVVLVAAVAENGVIGRDGDLPWHLPDDLRQFKRLTVGHTLVMGRRTYESIGRPLPERRTVVLSRDAAFRADGVDTATSLDEALARAGDGPVFVVGGAGVFADALPLADELVLTRVHAEVAGDVVFPAVDGSRWRLESAERHDADARHAHAFTVERYRRVDDD